MSRSLLPNSNRDCTLGLGVRTVKPTRFKQTGRSGADGFLDPQYLISMQKVVSGEKLVNPSDRFLTPLIVHSGSLPLLFGESAQQPVVCPS